MWRRFGKLAIVSNRGLVRYREVAAGSLAIAMLAVSPCAARPIVPVSGARAALERSSPERVTVSQTVEGPEAGDGQDPDLEQAELEVFATAFVQMVELRKEASTDMAAAISSENFTPQQYLNIRDGRRDNLETEDMARFLRAEVRVNRVRKTLELEMEQVVEDEGMTAERFQEIFAAIEATPELQNRLQQIWQQRL